MKVVLVNGSPHASGCTYTALKEVEKALKENGVETRIYHIGNGPVRGCAACGSCVKLGRCIFDDDACNELASAIADSDGVVIGTPVYYAGVSGALCALLDRVFYSSGAKFRYKPAAAVVSCRRGGASAAFDRLNKYFTISQMPVVPSVYWNSVHGNTPEQVLKDLEGLQVMRTIGNNMAYMLKSFESGGIAKPETEKKIKTNFSDGK